MTLVVLLAVVLALASDGWAGRTVTRARDYWRPLLPMPCRRCSRPVHATPERGWQVGHIVDRAVAKRMGWTPAQINAVSNQHPEHTRCNLSAGGRLGAAMTNAARTPTVADLASQRARGIRGL